MIVLKYTVRNQRLSRYNSAAIVEISDVVLEFDFQTSDWVGVEKEANFSYGDDNYRVALDKNNRCQVPQSVINVPFFKVAVYGGNLVTNVVKIFVNKEHIDEEVEEKNKGKYYTPVVDSDGNLSWVASHASLPELPTVNIKGVVGDTGVGIQNITLAETQGLLSTYYINYTNGEQDSFVVSNGADGHSPVVTIQDGNWYVDGENTGVKAIGENGRSAYEVWLKNGNQGTEEDFLLSLMGEDGVSITGIEQTYKSEDNSGNNLITVTLSDGKTFPFEIKNGKGIDFIESMSMDSDGSITHNNYIVHYSDGTQDDLLINAMNGKQGAAGKDGNDGFSPVIDVQQTESGNRITIVTDALGNEYVVEIKDGINGVDGVGIASIEQTGYSNVDDGFNSFTITLTDGTTNIFNIKNGSRGEAGPQGDSGVYVGGGEMPDGYYVQIDPEGEATPIPTKLSELTNDVDFVPRQDVPTKLSQLTNDKQFITMQDLENNGYKPGGGMSGDGSAVTSTFIQIVTWEADD